MKRAFVLAALLALAGCGMTPRLQACNVKGACVINSVTNIEVEAPKIPAP